MLHLCGNISSCIISPKLAVVSDAFEEFLHFVKNFHEGKYNNASDGGMIRTNVVFPVTPGKFESLEVIKFQKMPL